MRTLTVVIPVGKGDTPEPTLSSLGGQTFQDFDLVVIDDDKGNANWARNQGFLHVRSPFVLFSDADIQWAPQGLQQLMGTLSAHPEASYSYGAYRCGRRVNSNCDFDAAALRRKNFISTMGIIRTPHFPGFDETIGRLQDWDLWLTMLEQGHVGVYCGQIVFTTDRRPGVTYGGRISWSMAERIVKAKHGIM